MVESHTIGRFIVALAVLNDSEHVVLTDLNSARREGIDFGGLLRRGAPCRAEELIIQPDRAGKACQVS